MTMVNSGSLAQNLKLTEISDEEITLELPEKTVEGGKRFVIVGDSKAGKLHGQYSFTLSYEDADGSKYKQQFEAYSVNLTESRPELIPSTT